MNYEAFKKQQNERFLNIMRSNLIILAYQNGATNVSYEDARSANEFLLLEEVNKIVERYQKKGMK